LAGLARAALTGLPRSRLATLAGLAGAAPAGLGGGGLAGAAPAGLGGGGLAGAALGGLRGAAAGRRPTGGGRGLSLARLGRPALAAAALERRTQLVGHVRRHRRGVALYLNAHGGQLGEQVLGRDPKLLGDFIDPWVAQPDLTSSFSLERRHGCSAASIHNALRSASTVAPTAAVSVVFRARWMLRRLTAVSRQAGCPHR
jgi:hypothetical protein